MALLRSSVPAGKLIHVTYRPFSTSKSTDENSASPGMKEQVVVEHTKVYLQILPAISDAHAHGIHDGCVSAENDRQVVLTARPNSQPVRNASHQRFTFTHVFPPETSQKQFFDGMVHSLVSQFELSDF